MQCFDEVRRIEQDMLDTCYDAILQKPPAPRLTIGARWFLFFVTLEMDKERALYIGKHIIDMSLKDEKFFDALAFMLILKSNFINSSLYQWSYRKVMNICHCNFAKAKEIVGTAFALGWLEERATKDGKKYIVAKKLHTRYEDKYIFHVVDSSAGKQIFISRKNKPLKCIASNSAKNKMARLIVSIHNNRADEYCVTRERNKKNTQTFKEVKDIILEAVMLGFLVRCQKSLIAVNTSSGKEATNGYLKQFAEGYQKNGVSYERLAKLYGRLNLSRHQISRLVHKMKRYGLLTYKQAKCPYLTLGEEENMEWWMFNRINPETGKKECLLPRCWRNTHKDIYTYNIYNGNIYETRAIVLKKRNKPHKCKKAS